ncbi:LysR family transcriptional regulator [Phreatobacter sp. AB_2022a]|uniref:LysR family transcriptional regulator n=1 Tax=Phreatobacter sp. AB_2022a TaxID=3003134 RepID=UPI0022874EE7|nr:LysR family transcriptional regulator [Phreatobacter sp. AB_2022a]MCZ0738050.1 LysR family transcriptional regulator [Phreatobacter sp. AB_2022a]
MAGFGEEDVRPMGRRRAKLGRISDIDLRLLRVFQVVAECRGLAAAELRLGISRSTISTHLSGIEARLGVRLCERGRAGFELTPEGAKVYRATAALMRSLGDFQDEIETLHNPVQDCLKVALLDTFVHFEDCRIGERLRAFSGANQDVKLDLFIMHPGEVEKELLEGNLDVALTVVIASSPDFEYYPMLSEDSFLYCGSKHALFAVDDASITEADLRDTSYASKLFARSPVYLGQSANVAAAEAFHVEAMAHFILSGHYIGFLPEPFARLWTRRGDMRAIRPDLYRQNFRYGLAARRSRPLPAAAKRFIHCMTADLASLA